MNDYSAVKEEQADYEPGQSSGEASAAELRSLLLRATATTGKCYVLTFSEKHNVTLADMAPTDILPVIQAWTRIYATHVAPSSPLSGAATVVLESLPTSSDSAVARPVSQLRYMQIFENKGAAMGCSNPHPHCQIWTTSSLPEEPSKELEHMRQYRRERGRHILGDYVQLEMSEKERVVWQNGDFLVVCPWWAIWPFEVLVLAKRHVRALVDLTDGERLRFAEAIQEVTRRYDNLFETSFPYSESTEGELTRRTFEELTRSRLGHPSGTAYMHRRRVREQLVPHALLPAAAALCHRPQVSRGIRAHGGTPARHHTRTGCCATERLWRRALPEQSQVGEGKTRHSAEVSCGSSVPIGGG